MLATCCTHCGTRFRVTSAQLQARSGQVRCGRCNQVFNALETLDARTAGVGAGAASSDAAMYREPIQRSNIQQNHSPDGEQAFAAETAQDGLRQGAESSLTAPVTDDTVGVSGAQSAAGQGSSESAMAGTTEDVAVADRTVADATVADATAADATAADTTAADTTAETVTDATADSLVGQADVVSDPAAISEPARADSTRFDGVPLSDKTESRAPAQAGIADAPASRSEGTLLDHDNPFSPGAVVAPPLRRRHPLLAAGSALLLLLVAAQALYFYRDEIAARFPVTRDLLTRACEPLRCTVSLPRRPEAVVIEASDLQATDASAPGRIRLTATLRNHAAHVVAFPALDLVLTNANDHTLARRVFLPAEYLEPASAAAAGLAPKAEATVRLTLDTGELGAAGFRLAVLAAPLPQ